MSWAFSSTALEYLGTAERTVPASNNAQNK